jgi:hypothetical protein
MIFGPQLRIDRGELIGRRRRLEGLRRKLPCPLDQALNVGWGKNDGYSRVKRFWSKTFAPCLKSDPPFQVPAITLDRRNKCFSMLVIWRSNGSSKS